MEPRPRPSDPPSCKKCGKRIFLLEGCLRRGCKCEEEKKDSTPMPRMETLEEASEGQQIDEQVTYLYRMFKEWNKRGFSADDVTWCEVKGAIEKIHQAATLSAMKTPDTFDPSIPAERYHTWCKHHQRVSELDSEKLHKAEKEIEELKNCDYFKEKVLAENKVKELKKDLEWAIFAIEKIYRTCGFGNEMFDYAEEIRKKHGLINTRQAPRSE